MDPVIPAWMLEVADIVRAGELPDAPAETLVNPGATRFTVGMNIYPHVAVCDQCMEDSCFACQHCGAGLHSEAHAARHIAKNCGAEDNWHYYV